MAILNLYFESGSRAYVMHMSNDVSLKPLRILRENTNAKDELLRLQKSLTLVSYENSREDRIAKLKRIELKDNVADVYYEDGEGNDDYQKDDNSSSLFLRNSSKGVSILDSANNGEEQGKYYISIHYQTYIGKVEIVCSPTNSIYDVVLDFGSEASQMLIQRRDSGILCEPIELFKGCAKHFYGISENEIEDSVRDNIYEYDQQDEDKRLFRSVFFVEKNKKSSNSNNVNIIISRPSPDDDLISFISRRDKKETGQRIPNVKISYLADINPSGLNMIDLHRGMVMRFIHEALCTIAEKEKNNYSHEFSLCVTLLVPNVMCQNDVSAFVRFIQDGVENPEFLKQIPRNLKLAIVEIRTCSESDASLLNWINKQQQILPGRYLIIDIGKGTTDFSVVKVNNARQAESMFRAGFVGAGNVLSYAILDNYLTHLVSPIRRKRKELIKKLLSSEPARLYQLEQAIERIKRREVKKVSNVNSSMRMTDVNNLQVETLIEKIESDIDVPDDFNIISDIIFKIVVKEIAGRIKNIEFDHIILSGRAFKYKPLYDEARKDFQEIFPHADVYYDVSDAKKGCLYGPLTPIEVSKFSNMVGEPKSVNISIKKEFHVDIDERVESLKKREVRDNPEKRKTVLNSIADLASKGWRFVFSEEADAEDDSKNEDLADSFVQLTKKPQSTVKKEEEKSVENESRYDVTDIMSKGIPIPYYGANTRIYISGNSYVPQDGTPLDSNVRYSIYFDGDQFYLRSKESCRPLRKDTTLTSSSPLLFESLFPYSIQLLGPQVEIPVPKALNE